MGAAYDRGYQVGWWTRERLLEVGCHSVRERLEAEERGYQYERSRLAELKDPELAKRQAEYLEGFITAVRVSLRPFLEN